MDSKYPYFAPRGTVAYYRCVTSKGERVPQSVEIQHSQANKEI